VHEAIIGYHSHLKTNTYCIGHSLGAHLCGFFGKRIKKDLEKEHHLKKIVGMDPAGPIFQHNNENMRLNKYDATMVEIIHTNTNLFGHKSNIGHLDFYINGGKKQWWCGLLKTACSHTFSHELMTLVAQKEKPCLLRQKNSIRSQKNGFNIKYDMVSPGEKACMKNNLTFHLGSLNGNLFRFGGEQYQVKVDEDLKQCKILKHSFALILVATEFNFCFRM
jgi:hypothetical protein